MDLKYKVRAGFSFLHGAVIKAEGEIVILANEIGDAAHQLERCVEEELTGGEPAEKPAPMVEDPPAPEPVPDAPPVEAPLVAEPAQASV